MKTVLVENNDKDKRLDKFVSKLCPELPTGLMYKYIRLKRIKVNGKRCEIGTHLKVGDRVDLYISDEFFENSKKNYDFLKAGKELDIVYEDENILLANKGAGLLCHPDKTEYNDTLIGRITRYLYEKGEYNPETENTFKPALANRIDRNTAGIVIAAKNAESLKILCEKIKLRQIDKRYLCAVHGVPKEKTAVLEGYLKKDEAKNKVTLSKTENGGKAIKTKYRLIKKKNGLSLLEIELLTGRTHQIRAQMANIKLPLVGDTKYGVHKEDKKAGFKGQALYSYKLSFFFSTPAGILEYLNGKTFMVDHVPFAEKLFGK